MVGPLKHEGLHGKKYWVLFTDNRTRFRWIYCISNRGSAASTLKQFVRMIKTQTGITIGCFRLDGAAEWFSKDMTDFFKDEGILTEVSTLYTAH